MPVNNFGIVDRKKGALYRSAALNEFAIKNLALFGINRIIKLNMNSDGIHDYAGINVDYHPTSPFSVDLESLRREPVMRHWRLGNKQGFRVYFQLQKAVKSRTNLKFLT